MLQIFRLFLSTRGVVHDQSLLGESVIPPLFLPPLLLRLLLFTPLQLLFCLCLILRPRLLHLLAVSVLSLPLLMLVLAEAECAGVRVMGKCVGSVGSFGSVSSVSSVGIEPLVQTEARELLAVRGQSKRCSRARDGLLRGHHLGRLVMQRGKASAAGGRAWQWSSCGWIHARRCGLLGTATGP